MVFVSIVPIGQTSSYSAKISNSGDLSSWHYAGYTTAHPGTFRFSWYTLGGGTVTFSLVGPYGALLYSSTGSSTGSANLSFPSGGTYQFGMYGTLAETVRVTGTLSYTAPLL